MTVVRRVTKTVVSWITHYPWALVAAAACYLAGVVTMLDSGFTASDAVINLVGSGVASVAGIGGALVVVLASGYLDGRNIAEYVVWSYNDVARPLGYVVGMINPNPKEQIIWDEKRWADFVQKVERVRYLLFRAESRMRRVEPNLYRLKAGVLHLTNLVQEDGLEIRDRMHDLQKLGEDPGLLFGVPFSSELASDIKWTAERFVLNLERVSDNYGIARN